MINQTKDQKQEHHVFFAPRLLFLLLLWLSYLATGYLIGTYHLIQFKGGVFQALFALWGFFTVYVISRSLIYRAFLPKIPIPEEWPDKIDKTKQMFDPVLELVITTLPAGGLLKGLLDIFEIGIKRVAKNHYEKNIKEYEEQKKRRLKFWLIEMIVAFILIFLLGLGLYFVPRRPIFEPIQGALNFPSKKPSFTQDLKHFLDRAISF